MKFIILYVIACRNFMDEPSHRRQWANINMLVDIAFIMRPSNSKNHE